MPKFVVCEVSSVVAKTVEEALLEAQTAAKGRKSVVYVAEGLRTLPHPVHLQEVINLVGDDG